MDLLQRLLPRPGRDRFARIVGRHMRGRGVNERIRYEPEVFRLLVGEEQSARVVNLGNFHARYVTAWPWHRRAILDRLVATFTATGHDLPATLDEVRSRLLPGIRDRFDAESVRLQTVIDGQDPFAIPGQAIGDRISACLIVDFEESMGVVADHHLEKWGLDFDEGMQLAVANLDQRTTEPLEQVSPGVYGSRWADEYDASRILLPRVLRGLDVEGDTVAFCPLRGALVVTGADEAEVLARTMDYAESTIGRPGSVSALPLRYRWPDWEPFEPAASHPTFARWCRLRTMEWANVYGSQRELLCRLHEVRSKDVFVAAYTAVQHSDSRRISSYCVWTDGVDSLLPRADDVFFTWGDEPDSEEGEHLKVPWAIVERTCGDLMEATGDYPPRYRVRAFPDLSRLQAMRAASEPMSRA